MTLLGETKKKKIEIPRNGFSGIDAGGRGFFLFFILLLLFFFVIYSTLKNIQNKDDISLEQVSAFVIRSV